MSSVHAPQVAASVMPWAVCETALPLQMPAAVDSISGQAVEEALAERAEREAATAVGVAVIRASGIILPRVDPVFEMWGYAVSCEGLAARIEAAAATAEAVAVLFDSPGGSVAGVAEAAARIAAVSSGTPVVAVSDHLAASAAYWLAASCTAVVVSPSAMVGSIGVRMLRPSFARALDAEGTDLDVIYRGEGKLDYVVWVALDDDGRERLQRSVDASYLDFVKSVSAGRGVPRRTVTDDWGAQMVTADSAVKMRLADEKRPAAEVVDRLGTTAGRRRYSNVGAIARLESSLCDTVSTTSPAQGGTRA